MSQAAKKPPNTAPPTREQGRAEYEAKTKSLIFTKDFQSRQEAVMRDTLATVAERVMACILRRSWGEYSLYAIKDDGAPFLQRDICLTLGHPGPNGKWLPMDKSTVSHVVAYYQDRGYLDNRSKLLYPVVSPVLATPTQKYQKLREYPTFYEHWKVAYSAYFEREQVARSTLKEIRIVRNSHYKKWRKEARNANATLLETSESNTETVKLAIVSPFERDLQRHKAAQTQPKNPPVDGGMQFNARQYLFERIAHMQQAFKDTSFANPLIDPKAPEHKKLVDLILEELQSEDEAHVVGYILFVTSKFKGIHGGRFVTPRAPGTEKGPVGLGLLATWARDYSRIELGRGATHA
jgi:hypothetical protein